MGIPCFAQLNESDTVRLQIRSGVNGILQTGNVELGVLRTRLELVARISPAIVLKSQNNSLYQEFAKRKADNDINSRNYLYYKPENIIYPFALTYFQTNFRLKIDSRFFTGMGVTYQIIRSKKHFLKSSTAIVYEETRFSKNIFNKSYYTGNHIIKIWRPTFYVMGQHKLDDEKIKVNHNIYWQPGIDRVSNQRIHTEIGLDFMVWKNLSLSAQYIRVFEEVIVENIKQNDGILTFGINYQLKHRKKA